MSRFVRLPPSWFPRFGLAAAGIFHAVRTQRNFAIHLAAAGAVVVLAGALHVGLSAWCLLALCVALVLAAELFNTSLENLARAVTEEENAHVRHALDISSGAVLVASVGAAVVGAAIFLSRLSQIASDWGG